MTVFGLPLEYVVSGVFSLLIIVVKFVIIKPLESKIERSEEKILNALDRNSDDLHETKDLVHSEQIKNVDRDKETEQNTLSINSLQTEFQYLKQGKLNVEQRSKVKKRNGDKNKC